MPEARPLSPQEAIPYTPAEAPKEEEQGYQWSNWLSNPLNELKFVGKVAKESIVDPVVDAVESVQALDEGYTPVYRGTKGAAFTKLPMERLRAICPARSRHSRVQSVL